MTRTLSGHTPRAQQRRQELLIERIRIKYQRRIANEIARAMREAGRKLEAGTLISPDAILAAHRPRIGRLLTALWQDSSAGMQEQLIGNAKTAGIYVETKEDVPTTPEADLIMQNWVRTIGAQKITQVTSTTVNDIRRVVNQGIEDGLSEREIARRIFAIAPTKSASRSQTIARTEVHGATSAAAEATAKASGIAFVKEWVTARDDRTRSLANGAQFGHAEMDGVRVGMNEKFKVPMADGGFEEIMYPGDPAGSAGNICNDRCAAVYVLP